MDSSNPSKDLTLMTLPPEIRNHIFSFVLTCKNGLTATIPLCYPLKDTAWAMKRFSKQFHKFNNRIPRPFLTDAKLLPPKSSGFKLEHEFNQLKFVNKQCWKETKVREYFLNEVYFDRVTNTCNKLATQLWTIVKRSGGLQHNAWLHKVTINLVDERKEYNTEDIFKNDPGVMQWFPVNPAERRKLVQICRAYPTAKVNLQCRSVHGIAYPLGALTMMAIALKLLRGLSVEQFLPPNCLKVYKSVLAAAEGEWTKGLDEVDLGLLGVRYFIVQDDFFVRLTTDWILRTQGDRPDWEKDVRDRRAQRWVDMITRWHNEGL